MSSYVWKANKKYNLSNKVFTLKCVYNYETETNDEISAFSASDSPESNINSEKIRNLLPAPSRLLLAICFIYSLPQNNSQKGRTASIQI